MLQSVAGNTSDRPGEPFLLEVAARGSQFFDLKAHRSCMRSTTGNAQLLVRCRCRAPSAGDDIIIVGELNLEASERKGHSNQTLYGRAGAAWLLWCARVIVLHE